MANFFTKVVHDFIHKDIMGDYSFKRCFIKNAILLAIICIVRLIYVIAEGGDFFILPFNSLIIGVILGMIINDINNHNKYKQNIARQKGTNT